LELLQNTKKLSESLYNGEIRHGIWNRDFEIIPSELECVEGARACSIG